MRYGLALPVLLYVVQVSHDYALELVLAHWGNDVAVLLSALLPAGTAAATVAISRLRRSEKAPRDPPRIVGTVGALLGASSCLSLYSLEYVDFRTRLVARSCKPAFVSVALGLAGTCGYAVRLPSWPRAIAVGMGGLLYAAGGSPAGPGRGGPAGVAAIVTALTAEATATVMQSHWLQKSGTSAVQMAGSVNLYKIPFSVAVWLALGGGGFGAVDVPLLSACAVLALLGALGQLLIFSCIAQFGGEFTASLGVGRKAITYGLSTITFGSAPTGGIRIAGLAMVLAGMMMPGRARSRSRRVRYRAVPNRVAPERVAPDWEVPV